MRAPKFPVPVSVPASLQNTLTECLVVKALAPRALWMLRKQEGEALSRSQDESVNFAGDRDSHFYQLEGGKIDGSFSSLLPLQPCNSRSVPSKHS